MNDNIIFGPGTLNGGLENAPQSAFGEILTADFKIQAAWSFNYNINPLIVTSILDNGGTISQEDSFAKLESNTDPNGSAIMHSKLSVTYTPGVGTLVRFTAVFDTPQADSQQLMGIGDNLDGWFFGYNGTQFGILKRRDGVDEWTYQENWNKNLSPDLNHQKGNVYEIRFQWLGFGMQYFGIENNEGNIVDVHQIEYANTNDQVSVLNPSLPLYAAVINSGNTTNIALKTPSAVGGSNGESEVEALKLPVGYDITKVITAGTPNYLFSIRNPPTYQGKNNRLNGEAVYLSFTTEGTKAVIFKVIFGTTLTAPVWNDILAGIVPLQSDIVATSFSDGIGIVSITLGKVDSKFIDVTTLGGVIIPDSWFTVTAESANASEVTVAATLKSKV